MRQFTSRVREIIGTSLRRNRNGREEKKEKNGRKKEKQLR